MEELFHVDRSRRLVAGQVIELDPPQLGSDRETKVAGNLFPNGISRWGKSMLAADPPIAISIEALQNENLVVPVDSGPVLQIGQDGRDALANGRSRIIEAFAEIVRLGKAPDKPSRLAAVYAYGNEAAADDFRKDGGLSNAPIWRLSVPSAAVIHKGDSSVLGVPDTLIKMIDNTIAYWDGYQREDSLPVTREVLLPPPVTIVERVR